MNDRLKRRRGRTSRRRRKVKEKKKKGLLPDILCGRYCGILDR
jgi:hypothetical protein